MEQRAQPQLVGWDLAPTRQPTSAADLLEDQLSLVPRIRAADKFFHVSSNELMLALAHHGEVDIREEYVEVGEGQNSVLVELRLNVHIKHEDRACWGASVKYLGKRIDCIDWEEEFDATDGTTREGWHRHVWSLADLDCENGKEQVRFPEPLSAMFVRLALEKMNVILAPKDTGRDLL